MMKSEALNRRTDNAMTDKSKILLQ